MLEELKAAHKALSEDLAALDEDDPNFLVSSQLEMRAEFMSRAFDAVPSLLDAARQLMQARDLILYMGMVIRLLDEDNDYVEVWANDGDYLPNRTFKHIAEALENLK